MDQTLRIRVGMESGALTGWLMNRENRVYGLSAYHVLAGKDMTINIDLDRVECWNNSARDWQVIGRTINGLFSDRPPAMRIDYAYFEVTREVNQYLLDLLVPVETLDVTYPVRRNTTLIGYSVMNRMAVRGRVLDLNQNGFDFIIQLESGSILDEGDSGMLWKTDDGQALAMHLAGNRKVDATISMCCRMSRILGEKQLYEFRPEIIG